MDFFTFILLYALGGLGFLLASYFLFGVFPEWKPEDEAMQMVFTFVCLLYPLAVVVILMQFSWDFISIGLNRITKAGENFAARRKR